MDKMQYVDSTQCIRLTSSLRDKVIRDIKANGNISPKLAVCSKCNQQIQLWVAGDLQWQETLEGTPHECA